MAFIEDGLPTTAMAKASLLAKNFEDLLGPCRLLSKYLAAIEADRSEFGLLSEGTYCNILPDIVAQLQTMSRLLNICVRNMSSTDEAFGINEPKLAGTLSKFLIHHRSILEQLQTCHSSMAATGHLYGAMAIQLHSQESVFNNLRDVIDNGYLLLRVRTKSDWLRHTEQMGSCLSNYAIPADAWERAY